MTKRAVARTQSPSPERKRLDSTQIAADFGPKGPIAKRAVQDLCDALAEGSDEEELFAAWNASQALPSGAKNLLADPDSTPFGRAFRHINAAPRQLLFAVQTYYALVVKAVAAYAVSHRLESAIQSNYEPLSPSIDQLLSIENGHAFRKVGIGNFPADDCFGWYSSAFPDRANLLFREMTKRLSSYELGPRPDGSADAHELFGELYASLIPRVLRHSLGEYYTPEWLVDFVLDSVGYDGDPSMKLIDPSCGSGAFLTRALGRTLSAAPTGPREASSRKRHLPSIVGVDVNPLATLAAKANYIITIRSMLPFDRCLDIPVHTFDLITEQDEERKSGGLSSRTATELNEGRFDLVVGNPPWVLWDNLSKEYREATKPLWSDYGLFSLAGNKGQMGGAKKDLSMLFVYRSVDRLLKNGGKLGFLITQSAFKTRGAGEGFRRFFFRGRPGTVFINVKAVHDLTALSPFPDAANRTALLICERSDSPTRYPVPYTVWSKRRGGQTTLPADRASPIDLAERSELVASPVDKERLGSSWLTVPYGLMEPIRKMIGPSPYKAWEGVNCAGLSGCFIVRIVESLPNGDLVIENIHDIGKIMVKKVRAVIEPDLVYAHLLGRDLRKWDARPSVHVILAQDPKTRRGIAEETMKAKYPQTLMYLSRFERQLRQRAAFKKYFTPKRHPFWSMFNVGTYTLERWRVGWRIMGSKMEAAVLPFEGEKPVLPHNTHAFVACRSEDEAHYLCAMLNSSLVNFLVRSYSVAGGKSFAPPHIMEYVKIPEYDASKSLHADLAQLSRTCHHAADQGQLELLSAAQPALDRLAGKCFGISASSCQRLHG
ncbi:MAG TPA: N-6 DNA methylase [bacterium]|nr:N-6 DNA methylase [bacterium]